jgi:hypothetical protein
VIVPDNDLIFSPERGVKKPKTDLNCGKGFSRTTESSRHFIKNLKSHYIFLINSTMM